MSARWRSIQAVTFLRVLTSGGGVFRSTDNGDSWTPVNNGLDCGNIWSLAIDSNGTVFAGTAGCGTGVYRSTDNGESWTLVNKGLTSTDIAALAINDSGTSLQEHGPIWVKVAGCFDPPTTATPGRNKIMALQRSM